MIELFIKLDVGSCLVPCDLNVPHGSGSMKAEEVNKTGPEDESDVFGVASCGEAMEGDEDDKGVLDRGLKSESNAGELRGVR